MKSYENYTEELAAYALDALNAEESGELAAQIAADAELAAELEIWRDAAAFLAHSVTPSEPSFQVRSKIIAAVKKSPRKVVANEQNSNNGHQPETAPTVKSNVVTFPQRALRTSFFNNFAWGGAIAASILAAVLGVLLFNSWQNNQEKSAQIAAVNQKLAETERKLNETNAKFETERQERELLASPASAIFALDGTPEMPTAQARLVFDKKTGRALLHVENLPGAPTGKTYQIWWISDPKKPAPGGTFGTDAQGTGELRDQIPAQFTSASVFAVTLEPVGGSPAPTSKPILISPLS